MMKSKKLSYVFSLCLLMMAGGASANIINITGAGILMDPSVESTGIAANFFNDTNASIRAWNEQQNVDLGSDLIVDITIPGSYSNPFTSEMASISAGKSVSSHLLFYDPQSSESVSDVLFEFDGDIIGVIVSNRGGGIDLFVDSDFLGNPDTNMANGAYNLRGLEFGPESVDLDIGLRELTVNLTASSPGDQIRVITMNVPEPTSLVLLGLGLLGLAAGKRRML